MPTDPWPSIAKSEPPQPYALVTATASGTLDALSKAVRDAFQDAMAMRGRLRDDAYAVDGFSGRKFRLFLNNLMSEVPDPRYMEIGLYHGASFCPALFKNKLRAVGIDNWTEYGGKRELFTRNLDAFRFEGSDIQIIEQDFRTIDYDALGKFNIVFYDGSHTEKDQYDGVFCPQPAMDATHIMIIDDWNWDHVRRGTYDAMRDAGLTMNYSIEVRTTFNDDFPLVHGPKSEWHNGAIIAVVSKGAANASR